MNGGKEERKYRRTDGTGRRKDGRRGWRTDGTKEERNDRRTERTDGRTDGGDVGWTEGM